MVVDRKINSIRALAWCNSVLNVALGGKRPMIFFLSSCFFAAGWVSQLALGFFYPGPLESSGPVMLMGTALFGSVMLGLILFMFGIGSLFIEEFDFKRALVTRGFARINFRTANLAVHAANTVAVFLTETCRRKLATRELPGPSSPTLRVASSTGGVGGLESAKYAATIVADTEANELR